MFSTIRDGKYSRELLYIICFFQGLDLNFVNVQKENNLFVGPFIVTSALFFDQSSDLLLDAMLHD